MPDQPLPEQIRTLIAHHLGFSEHLPDETLLADLDMDSLDRIELAMILEEHFGHDFDESMFAVAESVGGLIAMIAAQMPPPNPYAGVFGHG